MSDNKDMRARILPMAPEDLSEISQLTEAVREFNLTNRSFAEPELERILADESYITLCGRLEDKGEDKGISALVIGFHNEDKREIEVILWLMAPGAAGTGLEYAMMDEFKELCYEREVLFIRGHYNPSAGNSSVEDFYADQGYLKVTEDEAGNADWIFDISLGFRRENSFIEVISD